MTILTPYTTLPNPHTAVRVPNTSAYHPAPIKTSFKSELFKFLKRKYTPGRFSHSIPQIFPFLKLFLSTTPRNSNNNASLTNGDNVNSLNTIGKNNNNNSNNTPDNSTTTTTNTTTGRLYFNLRYSLTDAWIDALAGVTLSTVLIPQSLSYAVLAGLTPQYGLYAAFFAPLMYFLFGTTRELSVGPFALVSIIIGQMIDSMYPTLEELTKVDPVEGLALRLTYTMTLTFFSGIWLCIMAIFKLGWIIDLVSTPAVNGLIMATALTVSASQLGSLFQVNTGQGSFLSCVIGLFKHIGDTNFASLLIGLFGIGFLFACDLFSARKKLKIPLPSQIVLVVAITLISALFNFNKIFNLAIVGEIPMGFLPSTLPDLTLTFSNSYLINAFLVAVVCFVISSSVSQQMSGENKYKVNYNSELFSLGMASLFGSFVNSYTSSASLSRTSVVNACKPRTNLWNVWSCLVLLLVILFLGPLLHHLPKTVLASVVIGSFRTQFLKYDQCMILFKKSFSEGLVYTITTLVTLGASIQTGLICAFATSLGNVIIQQSMFKPTFLLQIPSTQQFDNYNKFTLSPYYQFLDEVEGSGGLSKRRVPIGMKKHRQSRSNNIDSELYGENDDDNIDNLNEYGQYENVGDYDEDINHHQRNNNNTTTGNNNNNNNNNNIVTVNNDQYNQFDFHNLAVPSSSLSSPHNSTIKYGQQNDFASLSPSDGINPDIYSPSYELISAQDPNVAVLHMATSISFLNSNPISEYITRYVEMHREYHKTMKKQLLFSSFAKIPSNTTTNYDDDHDDSHYNDSSQLSSRGIQQSDDNDLISTIPTTTTKAKNNSFGGIVNHNNNNSIHKSDNYHDPSDITMQSQSIDELRKISPSNLRQTLIDPTITMDEIFKQYTGNNNNNNSQQTPNVNNTTTTATATKTLSTLRYPPLSPSTQHMNHHASHKQRFLFTAMVYDTLKALNDTQIAQYEFCIILDNIISIDLTGEAMLTKLQKTYPFVLFLFTRPSDQFSEYITKTGKITKKIENNNGNDDNDDTPPITITYQTPSGFIIHDLYIGVQYAKYIIDIATAQTLVEQYDFNNNVGGDDNNNLV